MSLRTYFVSMFLFFVVAGYGLAWFYGQYVLVNGIEYHEALEIAFVAVSILLTFIGFLLIFTERVIAGPVRDLTNTVNNFSENGEIVPVRTSRLAPKEVRVLVKTFLRFVVQVKESQKRTAETARIKTDFISTAAHQIRTPLTGIRWALEALLQDDLKPEQKELITSATEKSHELVNIVKTLLDISSIESGKYKYTFTKISMQPFLAKEVEEFQHLAEDRKITLRFLSSETPLPDVRVDKERIKWVLDNLIENAIRYTPEGGFVEVWEGSIGTEKIAVYVRDTGIGIPDADRANIFERFFRSSNAIAKENGGNGLGLNIARTIATDHGGDLNFVSNTKGIGTTFTLSLPVAP